MNLSRFRTEDHVRLQFLFDKLHECVDNKDRKMKVLDVGNLDSNALIHQEVIKEFPNVEVHGLDIVDQNSIGLSLSNQKIGSFEDLPYEDNFFDVIYIGEVLEHTWKPKQVLDRCYSILKKDGFLILDTPNIYSLSRMIRYFFTGKDIILGNPDHKLFFSRAMLENVLQSSGFTIMELTTESSFVTMRLKFKLPRIGPFRYMGECLMVIARK